VASTPQPGRPHLRPTVMTAEAGDLKFPTARLDHFRITARLAYPRRARSSPSPTARPSSTPPTRKAAREERENVHRLQTANPSRAGNHSASVAIRRRRDLSFVRSAVRTSSIQGYRCLGPPRRRPGDPSSFPLVHRGRTRFSANLRRRNVYGQQSSLPLALPA